MIKSAIWTLFKMHDSLALVMFTVLCAVITNIYFQRVWPQTEILYPFNNNLSLILPAAPGNLQSMHFWLLWICLIGEGNGTPLQYSCLENPMDRGAWQATIHGVAKSRTQLSNFTFTYSTYVKSYNTCVFCVWFRAFRTMFSRFIYLVACVKDWMIFHWMNMPHFVSIHPLVNS